MIRLREMRFRALLRKAEEKYGKPDVIHVHYPSVMGYKQIMPFVKKGVKLVATEHWSKVLSQKLNKPYRNSLKQYRRYALTLVSVSRQLKDKIEQITEQVENGCPLMIIPNIIPDDFYYMPPVTKPPFRFIAIGRLVPEKNFGLLIDAFLQAFPEDKNVKLTIVGNGPEYEMLQKKITEHSLEDAVELTGSIAHREIPALLQRSHVLVCSSKYETFGVPIIEAMTCGRPIITTASVGCANYINDSNGVIIEQSSVQSLANAMKHMYLYYESYEGKAISDYAKSFSSESVVYKHLSDIYQSTGN